MIRTIYDEHEICCGYRRITTSLCNSMAKPVTHKCVLLRMQKMGPRELMRAEKRYRHVQGMSDEHMPNFL